MPDDYLVLKTNMVDYPSVSVIVPVYNQASTGFLIPCLDSLVQQTLNNIEIICIDDASTDNSTKILLEYANRFPFFSIVQMKKNSRQGAARNRGIELAKGKYVSFIDSDDHISHNYLESLYDTAEKNQCDAVEASFQHVNENGIPFGNTFPPHETALQVLEHNDIRERLILEHGMVWAYLFRRSIFRGEKNKFPEGMRYEDTAIMPRLLLSLRTISGNPAAIYFYRQSSSSTIGNTPNNPQNLADRLLAADIFLSNAIEDGFYEQYKEAFDYGYFVFYYLNTLGLLTKANDQILATFNAQTLSEHLAQQIPDIGRNSYIRKLPLQQRLAAFLAIRYPLIYFSVIKKLSKHHTSQTDL